MWSVLEDAMLCVFPLGLRTRLSERRSDSIATFFGHMPWLGVYVGKIPALTGNLKVLFNNSVERATARLKRGSERKDLFYYLVRRLPSARILV